MLYNAYLISDKTYLIFAVFDYNIHMLLIELSTILDLSCSKKKMRAKCVSTRVEKIIFRFNQIFNNFTFDCAFF